MFNGLLVVGTSPIPTGNRNKNISGQTRRVEDMSDEYDKHPDGANISFAFHLAYENIKADYPTSAEFMFKLFGSYLAEKGRVDELQFKIATYIQKGAEEVARLEKEIEELKNMPVRPVLEKCEAIIRDYGLTIAADEIKELLKD